MAFRSGMPTHPGACYATFHCYLRVVTILQETCGKVNNAIARQGSRVHRASGGLCGTSRDGFEHRPSPLGHRATRFYDSSVVKNGEIAQKYKLHNSLGRRIYCRS